MHACRAARPYCQPYRKPSDEWLPAPFHSSTVSPIVSLSNHQGYSRTSGQVSGVHIITVITTVDHSLDRRCGYEHSGCGDRHRGRGPQRRVARASGSTAAILRRRRTAQAVRRNRIDRLLALILDRRLSRRGGLRHLQPSTASGGVRPSVQCDADGCASVPPSDAPRRRRHLADGAESNTPPAQASLLTACSRAHR